MHDGAGVPRLSVGVPVYNGEEYLAQALDSLLAQTYTDFELIVSDNASTDGTEEICRERAAADPRVRYVRQPRNISMAPNHNVLVQLARGELFKWGSHDDVYASTLLEKCVAALDREPDAVLAHSYTAIIERGDPNVARPLVYPLTSSSPHPSERFRSLLYDNGGDDDYGVIRLDALRRVRLYGSHYRADRTLVAELALHGRFVQVPEYLYFRRDDLGESAEKRNTRAQSAVWESRRANRWRHPKARLYAEYVWSYVSMVARAPLSPGERRRCYGHLAAWFADRALPGTARWTDREHRPEQIEQTPIRVSDVVVGYVPSRTG